MEVNFNIGMIAPSRAGKTTLMTAIFHEVRDRLCGNKDQIAYSAEDSATKESITNAVSEFSTCIESGDVFDVPKLLNTEEISTYRFNITIPTAAGTELVNIKFMDYPGSWIGTTKFETNVAPFVAECSALLVPVPADILFVWDDTNGNVDTKSREKNLLAHKALEVDNVVAVIQDWISRRCEKKVPSFLLFVPIRCEHCFNDNNNLGVKDMSAKLHNAIKKLYLSKVKLKKEQKNYVRIETHAVDTYGVVELRDTELVQSEKKEKLLKSTFQRRVKGGKEMKL